MSRWRYDLTSAVGSHPHAQSHDNISIRLQSILGEMGLLQMFPLLAETLCGVADTREGKTAGDYLKKIAALNQLVAVTEQLRRDAATHATQKYLAHQIALLHVSKLPATCLDQIPHDANS